MLVSELWLREWVRPDIDTQTLSQSLTLAGLEVGGIESTAIVSPKIVVGKIRSIESHPKADKLRICTMDVGRSRALKIVCGAPNARENLVTAVALIGAELPGGLKISKTTIRDVVSSGMLCSSSELGLDEDSAGIMELDSTASLGVSLNEHLLLEDTVLDVDLTPNRSDCLCVSGIAREISVLHNTRFFPPKLKVTKPGSKTGLPIEIKIPEDCPRFVGRAITGIDLNAKTPDWIKQKIRKSGSRPISLAVDITNYVMLELGQPMHAFDLDKLDQGIIVRHSHPGEELDLLDGSHIKIAPGTLLITDHSGPVALAGIMGGASTAISGDTTNIFLEAACFRPGAIAGRARALGMHTDASHRFERGVDPVLQESAIQRATDLLISVAGGIPGPVLTKVSSKDLPKSVDIFLRRERLDLMLGISVADRRVEKILTKLGMSVRKLRKGWRVRPPTHRYDISGEHDLIEEVARIFGYDNIPEVAPNSATGARSGYENTLPEDRLKSYLVDRDYREAITYSFIDPELQKQIDPENKPILLRNPIAANMSVMRTSLWPGLLTALDSNIRRQQRRVRLFESGHVFLTNKGKRQEPSKIAAITYGVASRQTWQNDSRLVDFFDLKGDLEGLIGLTGCTNEFKFVAGNHPALHPGQCSQIKRQNRIVGWIGALHPKLQNDLEMDQPVYLFEMELDGLKQSRVPEYTAVSKFPTTTRDLSILVDEEIRAGELHQTILTAGGKRLINLELFDVYRGKGVEKGKKSLSYTLTLQDSSRNLTDVEIEEATDKIMLVVGKKLNGKLRT
ncbi:MAG: phenylalanyl-tRNA synthetase beta chain [Parasphingorhabdus sp.]|jgi:phenylalanyl-tRNA synthetase beta chain